MATPRRSTQALSLSNDETELRRLSEWFRRFAKANGVPEARALDFELCLNELVANVIHHAYGGDGRAHEIRVALEHERRELRAVIEDDGRPFNPLEARAAEPATTLSETRIGGWGIPIVKALAGEIAYERTGAVNRVTIAARERDTI